MNLLELLKSYPWFHVSPAVQKQTGLYGVPAAAWAPLAANFIQGQQKVALFVAPNTEHTERIRNDLQTLFDALENPPEVLLWPLPDNLSSSAEADSRSAQERLALLDTLRRPAPHGLVVVSSANALAHT